MINYKLKTMTIWENIYQNYKHGGQAWASLSADILPLFREFIKSSDFPVKNVLDIGCGTGNYLIFLKNYGFRLTGIDSSPTAVEMAKNILHDNAAVFCQDMFKTKIGKNEFDLIISIAAIYHGHKKQIQELVNKIFEAIVTEGKVFITLPTIKSSNNWNTFKKSKQIAGGTFIPLVGPEKGLPHSFYSEQEVLALFSKFTTLQLDIDDRGKWIIRAIK